MLSEAGVAREGTFSRRNICRWTCPTRLRVNGSKAVIRELFGLGIPLLFAICTQGCVAARPATARTSLAVHASSLGSKTPAASNTPGAAGEALEGRLSAIRHELAVGAYTKAQQDLAALEPHDDRLSQAERREVKDDLCLTEYLIGQGAYPWSTQQKTCSEALAEPGSVSGAILARIHDAMKQAASEEVRRALEANDLAEAEAAALAYGASPGADFIEVFVGAPAGTRTRTRPGRKPQPSPAKNSE